MTSARAAVPVTRDPAALAQLHFVLRFATGVTLALILAEAMGWKPTFLVPALVATLLSSLPFSPPFKIGFALVVVMALTAFIAFLLSSLLRATPQILFGAIGLILFLALFAIAQGRGKLPATLLLLCISTVPVIAIVLPEQAGILPIALVRAMAVAMLILWGMHAIWPCVAPPAPPAPPPSANSNVSPLAAAMMGTAVILPMMLVYLMFGLADALPVLVTTVLIVTNLDPQRGAAHGLGMVFANLVGGLTGAVSYLLLQVAPSLVALALITFIVGVAFAARIGKGGPAAPIALVAYNSSVIILSSAIASGPTSSGLWLTRLSQFALACIFTVGMMSLVWRNHAVGAARSPHS